MAKPVESFSTGALLVLGILAFLNLKNGTFVAWLKTRLFNTADPASTHPEPSSANNSPLTSGVGSALAASFFEAVQGNLGIPYVYGGSSKSGVDCSGLVVLSATQANIAGVPRTSEEQFAQLPVTTSPGIGDLIFFKSPAGGAPPGHVAVLASSDGSMMISADHPGTVVALEAVAPFAAADGPIMGYRKISAAA